MRALSNLLILLLFFTLIGCFEYDEKLLVNEDGSGELSVHYRTEKEMKFQHLYFPIDEYEIRYNIDKNYLTDGVNEGGHQLIRKEEDTHVYMSFQFEDLIKLNSARRFRNEEFVRIVKDGNVTLQRFLYLDRKKLEKSNLFLKAGLGRIFQNEVLKEIRFRFHWVVPGKILSTNAPILLDENRALWIVSLADLLDNESTLFTLTYEPGG